MAEPITPAEVAETLGLSAPTVRRLGAAWERAFGVELPRDRRGARRWPPEALGHIEAAQEALKARRVTSLERGLALAAHGAGRPDLAEHEPPASLAEVLAELRALRGEVGELRGLVLALRTPDSPAE